MDRYVYCAAIREENDSLPRPPPKLRTVKVEPVDHGYEPQPAKTSKPADQDAALPHRQILTHNDDSVQGPQKNSLFSQRLMNGGVNDGSAGRLGIQERAGIPNAANGGIQNNSTRAAAPDANAGSGFNPPPTNSANVVPMDSQQNRNRPALDAEPATPLAAQGGPAPQPTALLHRIPCALGLLPPHPPFQHAPPQFYGFNTPHNVEGRDGTIERLRANVEEKNKEIEDLKGKWRYWSDAASNSQKLYEEVEQARLQASGRVTYLEKRLEEVNANNKTTFDQQNNSIFLLNEEIKTKNLIIDVLQKDKNKLEEKVASHAKEKEEWLKKEATWSNEKQELNQALEELGIQKDAEIAQLNQDNTLSLDNMKEFYENELDKFMKEMEEKKVRELKEMEEKQNSITTNLQAQIDDWSRKYETAHTKFRDLVATHSTSSERMKVKFGSREATGEEHAEEKKAERKRQSDGHMCYTGEKQDIEKNNVVSKEVKTEKKSSSTAKRSVQLGRPVSESIDRTSIEHANSLKIRILELNAENKVMSGELRELKRRLSAVEDQKTVDLAGPEHKKKKKNSEKLIDEKDNGKLKKTKSSEKPSDHKSVDTATNDIRKRGRPPKNSENHGAPKSEKMKHFKTPKSG
ncbi:hypothetical protein CAEBREN_07941 [Caenorhabditis brenneri]|uniref:Uncharacterized protein n=1 Tax=Caenorhabditis brenneri TaxID=135651 RepID=G0PBK3_CAEBE|nr:hypothetical protein CAEBREN_07941 [Caenorhabditis brenneri]